MINSECVCDQAIMMCDSVTRSVVVTVTRLLGLVQRRENMKERDFSMLLLQTFRKDQVKGTVESSVDVLLPRWLRYPERLLCNQDIKYRHKIPYSWFSLSCGVGNKEIIVPLISVVVDRITFRWSIIWFRWSIIWPKQFRLQMPLPPYRPKQTVSAK